MPNLLETNIYNVKSKVLICGTCLPMMEPLGYQKLSKDYETILYICLEKEHINMAITKICAILSTKNVESITFASVNKSPHCVQLHYMKNEIKRVMNNELIPPIRNIVIVDNKIHEIKDEALVLSKDLIKLSNLK